MKTYLIVGLFLLTAIVLVGTQTGRLGKWILIQQLETRLNAEVSIAGPLELSPGATTGVNISGLEIIYPDQSIRVDKFYLEIVTRSLFGDHPAFPTIRIRGVSIDIEQRGSSAPGLSTDEYLARLAAGLEMLDASPVDIRQLDISQGEVHYVDPDQDIYLTLSSASLTVDDNKQYDLHATGSLNREELKLTAALLRATGKTHVQLKGYWADYDIDLDATATSISPLRGMDVVFTSQGPSARQLLDLIGAQEVRDGELSVQSRIQNQGDNYIWITNLEVGSLILQSELTHSLHNPDFQLTFNAKGPSLREAGAIIDYLEYSDLPFEASGTVTRAATVLALDRGRIQLGDGFFKAEGKLPMFPDWANWELGIEAEAFDLSILQPFSPCQIPGLPMDWRGTFSSSESGYEKFDLDFRNADQSIQIQGELGSAPDFSGSNIGIKAAGLDLGIIGNCIGVNLDNRYPSTISLRVNKSIDSWTLNDVTFDSEILAGSANLSVASGMPLQGRVQLNTNNLHALLTAAQQDASRIQPIATQFAFNLGLENQTVSLTEGEFNAEDNSQGTFFAILNTSGETLGFDVSADFASTDLGHLANQIPEITRNYPVRLKTRWTSQDNDLVSAEAQFSINKNRLTATAMLPRGASLDGSAINLEGHGPNLSRMFAPFVPYPLPGVPYDAAFTLRHNGSNLVIENLLLETGGQQLSGNLDLSLEENLSSTSGSLLLKGSSSNTLFQLLGYTPDFMDRSYEAAVDINAEEDLVRLVITRANLGESDVSGEITITPGEVFAYNVKLDSQRIYLPVFVPSLITATDDKKDQIVAKDKVFPKLDLAWDWLSDIKLDFQHRAKTVDLQPGNHAQTQIAFAINNGELFSQNLSWQSDLSDGTAVLVIQQTPENPDNAKLKFEISSERIPMLWLFTGRPVALDGERLQFNAKLDTEGSNTLTMLRNLNGLIVFRGGGGVINSSKLDTLFGDFLFQLTKRVFSTADSQTNISCTGGAFKINKGKLSFDPGLAIRTGRFDILTSGEIDLPSEALKLQLNSRSRQGIGVSAVSSLVPRVGIGGTMAKPQIQVSATETALSGGAAIVSSGLTIIAAGLWDRLRSSVENPCDAVYDRALKDSKSGYGLLVNGPTATTGSPQGR